ncbi:MAG: NADH-quinone oxidoreductase subunit F, partial [Deltaproteobacteria bacterium]|nr:NADH-quinone oxidoreductase subunit F [Deltaproteobacteria bacterium]
MRFEEIKGQADKEWNSILNSNKTRILIGTATCGRSAGSLEVIQAFQDKFKQVNLDADIIEVGCMGPCFAEPLVNINKPGHPAICYGNVTEEIAIELVDSYLIGDDPLSQYALGKIGDGKIDGIPDLYDIPLFKAQERRLFCNAGFIDPTNIFHYIANDGYSGLYKALDMTPAQVIQELKKSGLRGRGGGGFPAWRKWEAGYGAAGDEKYVVCNADEGDPGAFMDRSVLESDPHAMIEGMIIGGYTIGSTKGYIYVRAEYPLAIRRLQIAIEQAKDKGFLGRNILGSDFCFDLEIFQGAGAFVCGESTALTLSIEGKRGMPKASPRPRTTEQGLYDKPTLLNNVKSFAFIPQILNQGGEWFANVGTENSKG